MCTSYKEGFSLVNRSWQSKVKWQLSNLSFTALKIVQIKFKATLKWVLCGLTCYHTIPTSLLWKEMFYYSSRTTQWDADLFHYKVGTELRTWVIYLQEKLNITSQKSRQKCFGIQNTIYWVSGKVWEFMGLVAEIPWFMTFFREHAIAAEVLAYILVYPGYPFPFHSSSQSINFCFTLTDSSYMYVCSTR